MALVAKRKGTDIPLIPADTYQAVCYSVIDLGTQESKFYASKHKVVFMWEIPELRITMERDGVQVDLPRAISKIYTLSLHEKSNLYRDLVSWRGKAFTPEDLDGFNVQRVAGANCLLQIVHKEHDGQFYARVSSVTKLLKNMTIVSPENPVTLYAMSTDGFDIPSTAPTWITDMVHQSLEWRSNHSLGNEPDNPAEHEPDDNPPPQDSDIPF